MGRDPVQWLLVTDDDPAVHTHSDRVLHRPVGRGGRDPIWQNLGITFIIIIAGLQSIPEDLYESAGSTGPGAWKRFRHVTLPMLSPTFLFASVVLSIKRSSRSGQIDLNCRGPEPTRTNVSLYSIYEQGFKERAAGDALL